MKKKATLYTSATLNGAALLITIDIALWLHRFDGFKKVSICCIANYNPLNFFSILLRLKNISSYFSKNKFKKIINILNNSKIENANSSALASFATGKLDKTSLKIGDLNIQFERIKIKNDKNLLIKSLSLFFRVIFDYYKYFRLKKLNSKNYLEYQPAGIYAGLHVLSEALRSDYNSCGSIYKCRMGILTALYKLHYSLEEYEKVSFSKDSTPFVYDIAHTYIYGFLSRVMVKKGAQFIETEHPQYPFLKCLFQDKYFSHIGTFKIKKEKNILDKDKIHEYYNKRIEKPWDAFIYMHNLKKIHPSNKETIKLEGVSVILYLHSFTDAQYYFGYDGYDDLMDWSLRTISLLNSNNHVSTVIVKPHPGINPAYHPGDVIANKYLKFKVLNFEKVKWADFHFDVKHISNTGPVIGITHHGSVAEELVYNEYPVIASTNSPWGDNYNFGYWWSDRKDYEALISGELISKLSVTKNHADELFRYCEDRHLSLNSKNTFEIGTTWHDMLKINNIEKTLEHGEAMDKIDYFISKIEPKEKIFQEYLSIRLGRINSLGII